MYNEIAVQVRNMKDKNTERTIPIIKEEVNIKKSVSSNTIMVNKTSDITSHVSKVNLISENVVIEEIIINREISEFPEIRELDNVLIIPIVKEVEVVTKQKILVKEIHVHKATTETTKDVPYTIREERVEIVEDK